MLAISVAFQIGRVFVHFEFYLDWEFIHLLEGQLRNRDPYLLPCQDASSFPLARSRSIFILLSFLILVLPFLLLALSVIVTTTMVMSRFRPTASSITR